MARGSDGDGDGEQEGTLKEEIEAYDFAIMGLYF